VAVRALRAQRIHNRLPVAPLPIVTVADYEDSLGVKVRDNRTGPIVINDVIVRDGVNLESCLIAWMPALPKGRPWNHFSMSPAGFSILPKEAVIPL
jgi:hypothetical protein